VGQLTFGDPDADLDAVRCQFLSAKPWPYLVLRDVVTCNRADVLQHFPDPLWDGWLDAHRAQQPGKKYLPHLLEVPEPMRSMLIELNAPPFLEFLEQVTGIDAVLPDPHLEGGGLHLSGPGGVLMPHTDFHWNQRIRCYRRLNVLIYLNPEWDPRWGGNLTLYSDAAARKPATTIIPEWGTCVIFRTDHKSVHGFPDPIVAPHWRRSIATYYYTAAEADEFSGDTVTYWRHRPPARGVKQRATDIAHRVFMRASALMSEAAYKTDPDRTRKQS
jgi:hypothetical protein